MRHVINHQVVLSQAPDGPLATWLDRFADAASRQGYTVRRSVDGFGWPPVSADGSGKKGSA